MQVFGWKPKLLEVLLKKLEKSLCSDEHHSYPTNA